MNEHDQVRDGMELVRWGYSPEDWDVLTATVEARFGLLNQPGPLVLVGSFATLITGVLAFTIQPVAGLFMVGAGAVITAVGALVPARYVRRLRQQILSYRDTPPEVLFTSTGVVFGRDAWLWRGERRLTEVRPLGRPVDCLVLVFQGMASAHELVIPIPPRLGKDVDELADLLRAKVDAGEGVRPEAPRPPTT